MRMIGLEYETLPKSSSTSGTLSDRILYSSKYINKNSFKIPKLSWKFMRKCSINENWQI